MNKLKDTDIQSIIGWILRTGVYLSIGIVLCGGIVYLYRHGNTLADYTVFKGVPDFVLPQNIAGGIMEFRGRAIIQAGIVLLIATPIIRVLFSAIGFVLEEDHLYTGITILVVLIILISLLSGHVG